MLTKESIIAGQMIADALGEAEVKPSPILAGLNEVSYGAFPFSSTEYVNQLVDLTTQITPHTEVMTLASTELGKIIRGAFDMIKTYGVPLAKCVASNVGLLYDNESVMRIIRNGVSINYLSLDNPLFNLSLYPTEVKNKSLGWTAVGFDMVKRLEFGYIEEGELAEWVLNAHPEVIAVMKDKTSSVSSAQYYIGSNAFSELGTLFKTVGDGIFDFTTIKTVDVSLLLKMYLIVSKMYMEPEPVKWLNSGTAEDYRSFVSLLWNGLTQYLIKLKEYVTAFRARQIVIVNNTPLRLKEVTPNEALGVSVDIVTGDFTVYYTEEVMRALTENSLAIGDVVLASLYSRASGVDVGLLDLVKTKGKATEILHRYRDSVGIRIGKRANEYFTESAIKTIAQFVDENQALREALYTTVGDKSKMVPSIIRERLGNEVGKLYGYYSRNLKELDCELTVADADELTVVSEREKHCIDIILSTELIPSFLDLLGCDLAAEIIRATYVTQEKAFTAVDERIALHEALIKVLARKLVG